VLEYHPLICTTSTQPQPRPNEKAPPGRHRQSPKLPYDITGRGKYGSNIPAQTGPENFAASHEKPESARFIRLWYKQFDTTIG